MGKKSQKNGVKRPNEKKNHQVFFSAYLRAMRFELILEWLKVTYFTVKLSSLKNQMVFNTVTLLISLNILRFFYRFFFLGPFLTIWFFFVKKRASWMVKLKKGC